MVDDQMEEHSDEDICSIQLIYSTISSEYDNILQLHKEN